MYNKEIKNTVNSFAKQYYKKIINEMNVFAMIKDDSKYYSSQNKDISKLFKIIKPGLCIPILTHKRLNF